jgi:hypothetical protein
MNFFNHREQHMPSKEAEQLTNSTYINTVSYFWELAKHLCGIALLNLPNAHRTTSCHTATPTFHRGSKQ